MGFNFLNVGLVALLNTGVEWATALLDWASRKPITINGAKKTADFNEPFTDAQGTLDTRFPKTGTLTAPNASTDVMDWDADSTTNQSSTHDLGTPLGTKFVIRGKVILDSITNTTSNSHQIYIGVYDVNHATSTSTAQDGFALYIISDTAGGNNLQYRIRVEGDGVTAFSNTAGDGGNFTKVPITGETIYPVLIRDGDKFTITLYADSDFSEVLDTKTFTETGVTGLQYLGIKNYLNSTTGGTLNGTWTDINVYDGVTTVENIPSQQTVTETETYDVTGDWTKTGSLITVDDVVADKVKINSPTDATHYVTKPLDETLSDEHWVAEIECTWQSGNNGGDAIVLGFMAGTSAHQSTAQDHISILGNSQSAGVTTHKYNITTKDGSTETSEYGTGGFTDTVIDYLRISRISSTLVQLDIFSDSARTNLVESLSQSIASTIGGLTHIHHAGRGASTTESEIDNLNIWNNISEVNPTTLTDYPLTVKIQGDADLQRKTTETVEDLFTTDNFTDIGAGFSVNTVTEKLDGLHAQPNSDSSNDQTGRTITALSDSNWCIDFDFVLSAFTAYSTGTNQAIIEWSVNSENTTVATTGTQDHLGFGIFTAGTRLRISEQDAGAIGASTGSQDFTLSPTVGQKYYVRHSRLSTLKHRVQFFADKARTILLEEQTQTIVATIANLDNLKLISNVGGASGSGSVTIEITNLRVWDGITNPVNQEVATVSEDFTSYGSQGAADAVWVPVTTATDVNIGTNVMDIVNDGGSTKLGFHYDFGAGNISDTNWCLRYKLNWTDYTQGSGYAQSWIGLSSLDGAAGLNGTQHAISTIYNRAGIFRQEWAQAEAINTNLGVTDMTDMTTGTDYFVQQRRDGNTIYYDVYSDSAYSIPVSGMSDVTPMTTKIPSGLRYMVFRNDESSGGSGTCTGTLTDVSFWNGISSPNASGRKIVFTDNAFDASAVEYSSETISYDPINGDYTGVVRIPSLTTGADTTIQMYCDYTPSANPSYTPELAISTLVESDLDVYNQTGGWAGAVSLYGAGNTRTGIRVEASSPALGKIITKVTGELSQTLSPTGTYKWTIRNDADTLVAETETGDASTLTEAVTETVETFTFDVPRILQEGDRIQLEYSGGDVSNAVNLSYNNSLPAMPTGFKRCEYNGSYTDTTTGTPYFVLLETKTREQSTYDSNYKAVHHLSGNSLDSTVYGNDGTNTAVDWEQQNGSVGLACDGATSKIDIGSDVSLDNIFDGGGTIGAWFNPKSDGEGSLGVILRKFGWVVWTTDEASGLVRLTIQQDWTTTDGIWKTAVNIPINELHRFDMIFNNDSVSNDPIIILDGIKLTIGNGLTETQTPVGARSDDGALSFLIGNEPSNTQTFDGFIGEVKISDKTRPSSEAITSYNAEKADSDIITKGTKVTQ